MDWAVESGPNVNIELMLTWLMVITKFARRRDSTAARFTTFLDGTAISATAQTVLSFVLSSRREVGETKRSLTEPYRVQVQTGLPTSAISGLGEFIETHYLTPNMRYMEGGGFSSSKDADHRYYSWTIDPNKATRLSLPAGSPAVTVNLTISSEGVSAEFTGFDSSNAAAVQVCDHEADDLRVLTASFLDHAKRVSLHFVFSVGHGEHEVPPVASGSIRRSILRRVFAGNNMNLYLILIAVSFISVLFLGYNAIIVILAVQGLALVFSDRLMLGSGTVRVTAEHPEVAVVQINCSPEVAKELSTYGKSIVGGIKDQIDRAISTGDVSDPDAKAAILEILVKAGVHCSLDDISIKKSNPYNIVKDVSEKFGLPIPKITMMNTPMDNAAATGISPGHASITITAGAIQDLKDTELESVIGHEFGHIKGRDPIILFVVTMVMYLGGLYLWLPILLDLGLLYFLVAFGIIYLVGKFLETRADTESVAVLGGAGILASALTRIGFTQLYFERYNPRARFLDWLRFDPHPPIYFRVSRLSKMAQKGGEIRHTLLVSVRDCISGFFGALAGS